MNKVLEGAYPLLEHRRTPTHPEEVIEDELRSGESREMFRSDVLHGLGAIYGGSPLGKSVLEHANVLGLARQYVAELQGETLATPDDARAQAFYAGALLAIHAELSLEKYVIRRRILHSGIGDGPEDGESAAQSQRRCVTELLWASDRQIEWFDDQPDALQIAVVAAAEQAYGDEVERSMRSCESEMIFGYVYVAAEIESARQMVVDV